MNSGYGPQGSTRLRVEKIATGLRVPWGIAFISRSTFLVTERRGVVRLFTNGSLQASPVYTVPDVTAQSESGLLGITLHPDFSSNRFVYLYYTASRSGGTVNRVVRIRLSEDFRTAAADRVIVDGIPAGAFHDGGRIHFGPDGKLYVGTGDGRSPERSQDNSSLAGKLLRMNDDGGAPGDGQNITGIIGLKGLRNLQAFDWIDSSTLVVADHGPTGDTGRSGHDEVSFARLGDNLGWPDVWSCEEESGIRTPFLVFNQAMPPGGLSYFNGSLIPAWNGSVIVASLGARHLQRIRINSSTLEMVLHEVYLNGTYGRLREAIEAPDGSLYVTTSNCDGRGSCGSERDMVLRITQE